MAAGTPLSGNAGKVKVNAAYLEITHWTYSGATDIHSYNSSETGGDRVTEKGNGQASGTVEGKRMKTTPIETVLKDGDLVTLLLEFEAGDGITFSARISNLDFDVNVDSGELQTFSFNYLSHGARSFT
jgi:hypothetical protein